MMYPLVTDLADEGIPVALTCRVLGFSKQAYFKWRANPVSQRDWDDAHLIHAARDVHHDDPEFGYRFIRDELAERGVHAGRNRVRSRNQVLPAATLPVLRSGGSGNAFRALVRDLGAVYRSAGSMLTSRRNRCLLDACRRRSVQRWDESKARSP